MLVLVGEVCCMAKYNDYLKIYTITEQHQNQKTRAFQHSLTMCKSNKGDKKNLILIVSLLYCKNANCLIWLS